MTISKIFKKEKMAITILSMLLFSFFAFGNGSQFVHADSISATAIVPTDDAYVVANTDDPQDKEGLQHINTGHLPFLKSWYAWDVTKNKERIISIVYLKFDLTKTSGPIESASLILHPFAVNLTAQSRPIEVYTGLNNNWNESSIVFVGAPAFSTAENSTAFISNSDLNNSVSWDVTRQVRQHEGSFLTLALVIRDTNIHNEELVDFYSKEASDPLARPDLVLLTATQSGIIMTGASSGTGTITDSTYVYLAIAAVVAIGGGLVILKRKTGRTPTQDHEDTAKMETS